MTWFKIDDDFFFHPKVVAAGNSAIGLFVRCGSWASNHLTDGHIPHQVIAMFGTATDIDSLVDVGLLEETDTGYWMPAFLDYNPSADEVKAIRAASAERQRHSRTRRSDDAEDVTRDSRVSHNDVTRDSRVSHSEVTRDSRVSHSAPTRPDPYKTPPPRTPVDNSVEQVVVAVAKRIIEHAPPDKPVRKRAAYLASMQQRLRTDHTDIGALVNALGLEEAIQVVTERELPAATPSPPSQPSEPQHDPDCAHCAGSGWRTIDHEHNVVGPCPCAPPEHLATVTELRRSS